MLARRQAMQERSQQMATTAYDDDDDDESVEDIFFPFNQPVQQPQMQPMPKMQSRPIPVMQPPAQPKMMTQHMMLNDTSMPMICDDEDTFASNEELQDHFDIKKAIIYTEILNRKY